MIVRISDREPIYRRDTGDADIVLASAGITITNAWCAAGEQIAGPHIHRAHTDAFYVLEGELTFEVGSEAAQITLPAGRLVAVPPEVAHSFRNESDRPARWLTIHAPDGVRCVSARTPRRC